MKTTLPKKGPLISSLWLLTPAVTSIILKYMKFVKPDMELCTKCVALCAPSKDAPTSYNILTKLSHIPKKLKRLHPKRLPHSKYEDSHTQNMKMTWTQKWRRLNPKKEDELTQKLRRPHKTRPEHRNITKPLIPQVPFPPRVTSRLAIHWK